MMQSSKAAARRGSTYLDTSLANWRTTGIANQTTTRRLLQTGTAELSNRTSLEQYNDAIASRSAKERARALIRDREKILAPAAPPSPFLTDRHQRRHSYLRISLTERCNLRCMYCMPEEGVSLTPKESLLTAPEVERIAKIFVQEGVNKIRLTGGEPTIRKDLPEVIAGLSSLQKYGLKQIGMTTNGLTLSRHLPELISSGLTHLNISLDTLDPFKFELMTKRPASGLAKVLKGIDAALATGVAHVKINVVSIRGLNDGQDVLDFVEWAKDRNITVRFIEYMPFDGNRWKPEKLVPFQQLLQLITQKYGPLERLEDDANDTSKHWRVPGHVGRIGFISSMTDHFCGTCNRLRITADGNLKVCLFGNSEVSLRDAMRIGLPEYESVPASDSQLLEIIGTAVGRKHAKHAGMSNINELAQGEARRCRLPTRSAMHRMKRWSNLEAVSWPLQEAYSFIPSARFYSSSSGDSRDPWDSLDNHFDNQIQSSSGSEKHQTWSQYMGNENDGDDDSPWSSLDAIADGAKHLASSPALQSLPKSSHPPDWQSWEEAAEVATAAYVSTLQPLSTVKSSYPIHTSEPRLTHLDGRNDRASMVDVSSKASSTRTAQAEARVYIPTAVLQLLNNREDTSCIDEAKVRRKGNVLQTAQLAGIMGAKRTSELIPLCHQLNLSHVNVDLEIVSSRAAAAAGDEVAHYILVRCTAKTSSQTGVEMEALTGASVAALTLWDMLKSVGGKEMRIDGLMVISKEGGKSGSWTRQN